MKCERCEDGEYTKLVHYPFGQLEHLCDDCYEDFVDSLLNCRICGKPTQFGRGCLNCGGLICFSCWDDCGPFCSAECLWIAQRESEADSRYDLMREEA